MFCVCHAVVSVHSSFVVTCWERANLLAHLYVMFYFVFVTFPCGVLGQVWFLIVSILDLCLLPYFANAIIKMTLVVSKTELFFSECQWLIRPN